MAGAAKSKCECSNDVLGGVSGSLGPCVRTNSRAVRSCGSGATSQEVDAVR
jgi:hypothetical protein